MKRLVILIILFIHVTSIFGQQDYFAYHLRINQAEEWYSNEQFEKAIEIYDEVFQEYKYVFLKDLIIAAQIAMLASNEEKAISWIERAVINGYDCSCLLHLPTLKNIARSPNWPITKSMARVYYEEYLSRIDENLFYEFHHRYRKEQENKSEKQYSQIVTSNFKRIKDLMDSIPFPSERIIGIDNQDIFPTTTGGKLRNCEVANSKVIPTLLHHDNPITTIGLPEFIEAIRSGHLHPRQFASIYTFEINYVSRLSAQTYINKPNLPRYYFNFPFGERIADMDRVNQDRMEFGICSVQVDQKKELVAKKYELKLNFGYK